MKSMMITVLALMSLNLFASENRTLEYWCDPDIRLKGLEAVLVTQINGETHLEVYTESRRWGAVDLKLEKAGLTINSEGVNYLSENNTVSLEINTGGLAQGQRYEFYDAHFVDSEFGFDMKMSCESLR